MLAERGRRLAHHLTIFKGVHMSCNCWNPARDCSKCGGWVFSDTEKTFVYVEPKEEYPFKYIITGEEKAEPVL
jgi:hypothetical protein